MPRPIIVEGPDGAGKSTLGAKLAQDLGRAMVHTGGATNTREELQERCKDFVLTSEVSPTVFDRCPFISDPVYKEALGIPFLIPRGLLWVQLRSINPVIVYCGGQSVDEMFTRISQSDKAHKSPEYLARVQASYPAIAAGYDREIEYLRVRGFTILTYNWSMGDYHNLREQVLKCAG